MLAIIYVAVALFLFFAQAQNGLFKALLIAIFWPIVIGGGVIYMFFSLIYHTVKK